MASMIVVTGKLFDKRRKITAKLARRTDVSFHLVQRESRTSTFTVLRTFSSGYIARASRFRNQMDFEIATELDIKADVLKMSHVILGTQVYAVSEGDIHPPNDTRFTWLIIGRITNQTFVVP